MHEEIVRCSTPVSSIMRIIAHKYALMGPYAAPLDVRGSHPVVRSPIICTSFGRWPANIRCMHEFSNHHYDIPYRNICSTESG
jgi:hypothetical protein